MPEQDQPEQADQGFATAEQYNGEALGQSTDQAEQTAETDSHREILLDYRKTVEADMQRIAESIQLYDGHLEAERAKPEDEQSREGLEFLERQRDMWERCREISQASLDRIDQELGSTE